MIETTLLAVVMLFPLSEIALAIVKRSRGRRAEVEDRGSMRFLWICIFLGVFFAFAAQRVPSGQVPFPRPVVAVAAPSLMVFGLVMRWAAIITLGRFFTVDVAIHDDHAVVDRGLYRHMRHPSYTGLLITFLGFGVSFSNWLSLAVLLVLVTIGVLNRVIKEERALLDSLGESDASYCARTKRFIPEVY